MVRVYYLLFLQCVDHCLLDQSSRSWELSRTIPDSLPTICSTKLENWTFKVQMLSKWKITFFIFIYLFQVVKTAYCRSRSIILSGNGVNILSNSIRKRTCHYSYISFDLKYWTAIVCRVSENNWIETLKTHLCRVSSLDLR